MQFEEIKKDLKENLSEKRYNHSIRSNENGKKTCFNIWRR